MSKFIFIIIILKFSSYVFAEDKNCFHDDNNLRCVKYIKNYDGDTITFNISNVHPLLGKKINVRVLGIDTPELKTLNVCEKDKARSAKKLVNTLLKKANRIDLENIKRDKYFRILADIKFDGKSLKEILIKNNLAYGYFGKAKITQNWCSSNRQTATKK